tara:strand:+ start:1647 stop:3533 length:1887 start_codon:yes stop_codon:yes gene_type:complete
MHIIFGNLTSWQIPLLRLLKYLRFKVFYLDIVVDSDVKKNEIAEKLKKKNIFPLPIELEKKLLPEASFPLCDRDPDEIAYKRNLKLIPDEILKKYCNLFSVKEDKIKKLRLILQDIFGMQLYASGRLGIWSALYPSKKIIYVSFKFMSFYMSNKSNNLIKIIIPFDIFSFFVKKSLGIFLLPFKTIIDKNNLNEEKKFFNNKNFKDFEKQEIALFLHKGIFYGKTKTNLLFEKSLYYSDNVNSNLNKYNLLHLDYSDYPSPDKNINWVCINTINISKKKIFFKTLIFSLKTLYLIRNFSTFLGWLLCIQQYKSYTKYFEIIKKFKNLKIALIDYDCLCPKTLILACDNNNVKTVATQERFNTAYYTSFANAVLNTYYTGSEHITKIIKESKYYDIKNIIPVGQYRSDYILYYKNQPIPNEISKAKENGKKILIVFAFHPTKDWFDSYTDPLSSWSAQIDFLEDMIKLSQSLRNTFIVLRYKTLDWIENKHFKKIFDKMNLCENIILCNNYEESHYSYKLCAHADLVIAKVTSIADECLSLKIPVLFHEYTHNMEKIVLDIPNYVPQELICNNFEDLYQKSKSILFLNPSKLEGKVEELSKKIYYVNKKQNIKKKIIDDLENQLTENKF